MEMNPLNAVQNYNAARTATAASEGETGNNAFSKVAADFLTTLQQGEDTARATMTGGADPHSLVQALAQTELAVETAVTVRNKVVEAYQEILRMPV
ncbi:flagellar hook-basal body complex protein FliE [Oceaniglobus ichthyenteri]|uniref:flagellar hook-basal body complex protein FliE n=1 Tax=Oceaniglobus ichthyenteri TaxID=2136177 RepID=UPI000D3A4755|nr:flagellar hook-basal body complex protein FliE [Oceaniglobus ichthyenteri]